MYTSYSDYMISNVADGDKNSFFWSSAPPVANSSYIMLDLKENLNISDIKDCGGCGADGSARNLGEVGY